MGKYNKKLIFDYIVGNEIIDYDIDTLENDYEFMMEVIKRTKDKKMYNLCSEEVKNNYLFIRFIVETFMSDLNFVNKIIRDYIEDMDQDDIRARELTVLISEHITRINSEDNMDLFLHKACAKAFYDLELCTFQYLIEEVNDEELKKEYGLGFLYYFDKYNTSKIICDFFAKGLVDEIFNYYTKLSLEDLLHKNFKTFNEISDYGVNKFLLDHISEFDIYLADYISENIELLNKFSKEIKRIEKNWDRYIEKVTKEKVEIFNDELSKFMNESPTLLGILDLTIYVIKKLNLEDTFYKNDPFLEQYYINEIVKNKISIEQIIKKHRLNINDWQCIKYAMNLAKQLFSSNIIEYENDSYVEEVVDNKKGQILKFDLKNKMNKNDNY